MSTRSTRNGAHSGNEALKHKLEVSSIAETKRRNGNMRNGNDRSVPSDEEDLSSDAEASGSSLFGQSKHFNGKGSSSARLPQDTPGFRPGSIMHISLHNFVTYSKIDISPGPNMNMIIGPNGTGKSTVVCAIALGLGANTSVLGRAKNISEFVKHGCERGSVELTLAGEEGNTIKISREIVCANNKSNWKINGRAATHNEVLDKIKALNIQVTNLCQFLPQDRVVEFSKMTKQDLLKETQSAVGRDDLLEIQKKLIMLRTDEKKMMHDVQRLSHDTDTLRKQNDVLERDVKRWQERQAAESQARILTALIPVVKYTEAKAEHDRAREARRQAHTHYLEVKNNGGPAEEEIQELESQIARSEAKRQSLQDERASLERKTRQQATSLEKFETKQRDLNAELEEIRRRAQKRRDNIAKLQAELTQLDASHPEEPPEGETEDMRRLATELRELKLRVSDEINKFQDDQNELIKAGKYANMEIEARSKKLKELDDVIARKRELLRNASQDTFKALEWLEANRNKFSQHVFAPICLEVSVKDPRYANLVETIVSVSTLRTFVTQCDEDYHTFTREVNDKQGLRVDVVSYHKDLEDFRPSQPRETLQALGFDGYVIDYIEAPRKVLAAMCNRDNIHEVPVALGRVDNETIESKMLFKEYIAEGTRFAITRGRYGSRSATVTTSRVKPQARILSSGETDEVRAMRERLHKEISMYRDQLQENEASVKKLDERSQKARNKYRQSDVKEKELQNERKRLAEIINKWQRNQVHIETKRAQLATMQADEQREVRGGRSQAQQERKRIEDKLRDNARDRAATVCEIADNVRQLSGIINKLALTSLDGHKDVYTLNSLKAEAEKQRDVIIEAQTAFEEANRAFEEAKVAARECLMETRQVTESLSDEERQAVRDAQEQRSDISVSELEVELHTCQQRLAMASNSGLSARVMEQYNERKSQLSSMVGSLQQLEHEMRTIRKKKLRLRSKWEDPLAELVGRIGECFKRMFDEIECMGEIRLCRAGDGIVYSGSDNVTDGFPAPQDDEDYDNWGIEILVSFRKNEDLHPLDNHRQSGGERAVSTIVYLQSLQSLVAAPFRVVDEINQGMDQRNERLVHKLIVDTACQKGSSQYFLITPKLLSDLEYHPMIRVLCIFNGEWQPESFNFKKYISNARQPAAARA
ncbi:hypothetical protein BX070DRAFT_224706 [Coemansia spiralis]|nr:hypothetical protein BX070DRAFT_224706 [Coemansia spiralis]